MAKRSKGNAASSSSKTSSATSKKSGTKRKVNKKKKSLAVDIAPKRKVGKPCDWSPGQVEFLTALGPRFLAASTAGSAEVSKFYDFAATQYETYYRKSTRRQKEDWEEEEPAELPDAAAVDGVFSLS